jgi:hypothetical protein
MSGARDPAFDRPVFIVSPPRSGSTLLFETLARAPDLYTVGGESHGIIEGYGPLNMGARGYASNRLTAEDAAAEIAAILRARFYTQLRDRQNRRPSAAPVRMLEKTPKNALRIPFLARVFPEARFVYLHREPREVMASMIEAWRSGRFRTYPNLPGWPGPPWSLLLTPGWQKLAGKPLDEIVAGQLQVTMTHLIDDLAALPPGRVIAVHYADIVADWRAQIARLTAALDLTWDQKHEGALPLSRYTVSKPDPEKWRTHETEIRRHWDALQAIGARASAFAAKL